MVALAAALEGYLIRPATWLERGMLLAAALLLIDPGLITDLVGFGLLGVGLVLQKRRPSIDMATPVVS